MGYCLLADPHTILQLISIAMHCLGLGIFLSMVASQENPSLTSSLAHSWFLKTPLLSCLFGHLFPGSLFSWVPFWSWIWISRDLKNDSVLQSRQESRWPPGTLHNCLSDSLTHSLSRPPGAPMGGSPFEPCCKVITVVREIPHERDIQRKRQLGL